MTARQPPLLPRVYWLTSEFFPPQMGGTGIITARLADGLAERGFDVQVVTRQTEPPSPDWETIRKVRVRRLLPAGLMKGVGWRAIPAMASFLARLASLLITARARYDLVFISGMKTIPLIAVPFCRLLGRKCIIRIESPFEIAEPISAESLATMGSLFGRRLSQLFMRAQRLALRRADRVIAISDEIAVRLRGLGCPEVDIVRIPNAIDLVKFTPVTAQERQLLRERLGFPGGMTIMLFVGRLSRAKGVMMLMHALPALVGRHPDLYLVLVGGGRESWDDCEDEVVAFIGAHQLHDHIALTGPSAQVHQFLQAADLFVSPSDYEGFGLTTVEALACTLPVVATRVGVAGEVIEHDINGFLCPPKDPDAFSATIELALRERQRWPQIGSLGRRSAARFDVPRVIDQYVSLCRELHGSGA